MKTAQWNHLNSLIDELLWDNIHCFEDCDPTQIEALAYAFLKDCGDDVLNKIESPTLQNQMKSFTSKNKKVLHFWQTIAPLRYKEIKEWYLAAGFEQQLEDVTATIFKKQLKKHLKEIAECDAYTASLEENG